MASSIKRLLLATDFSREARLAEEYAYRLASDWHAHLTIMTALEFPPGMNPDYPVNHQYLTDRMREASEQLADYKRRNAPKQPEMSTRIGTGLPSEEIVAAALDEAVDVIILGTRGKTGLAHVLLGSTAERVIRTAPCPVLAVHTAIDAASVPDLTIEHILVPVDFSDCSLDALEFAAIVATLTKADLELLHVLEPVSYGLDFTLGHAEERERQRARLSKRLEDFCAALAAAGIPCKSRLRGGVPADAVLEETKVGAADLVVMGTHGRRGLSHIVAGSVTEAVLRQAPCPVLTVRSPKFRPAHRRVVSNSALQGTNP